MLDDFYGKLSFQRQAKEIARPRFNSVFEAGFDFDAFLNRLERGYTIEDKHSSAVLPFGPLLSQNDPQKRLMARFIKGLKKGGPQRFLVLKSRKLGVSTATDILLAELAIQMERWRCLIISHTDEYAEKLFKTVRDAMDQMQEPLRPGIRYNRKDSIVFGTRAREEREAGDLGHQATIEARSAGGSYVGSGDTIRALHLSECAKYDVIGDVEQQEHFIISVLGSMPKSGPTLVVAETTANGQQGWFYKTWMRADQDQDDDQGMHWETIFIPWHEDPACYAPVPVNYNWENWPEEDKERERSMVEKYNVGLQQLMFRRNLLRTEMSFNYDYWDQEFPDSPETAFISNGLGVLSRSTIHKLSKQTIDSSKKFTVRVDNPYVADIDVQFNGEQVD